MAKKVIGEDDLIDEKEGQIDQKYFYSIAMRQPLREDLIYCNRYITTDVEKECQKKTQLKMTKVNQIMTIVV